MLRQRRREPSLEATASRVADFPRNAQIELFSAESNATQAELATVSLDWAPLFSEEPNPL
jgi:hypothetical protein